MKHNKGLMKVFGIPCLLVCVMFMCLTGPGQVFAKEKSVIKMRYGSYAPKTSVDEPVMWFIDEVSRRSGVKIELETYFSGTLAKAPDCLSAISEGVYDIGWISSAYTPGKLPYAMMVGSTPLVARSVYSLLAATDEVVRTFEPAEAEYKNAKVKFLFNSGIWHYDYIGTKPIKTLDDIKGIKARTYGYYSKAWSALGGVPVTISIMEAYDALQKGIVDGVLIQAFFMEHGLRLSEIAKHFTKLDFGCLPTPVIMNLETWNQLPETVKKAMQEVAKEMPKKAVQLITSPELGAIDRMKAKGVMVNILSAEDTTRLIELSSVISDQIVNDLAARGVKDTRKAMDIYLNALDKYLAQE